MGVPGGCLGRAGWVVHTTYGMDSRGEIGWGMYVRYLCVVFVRGMCACGLGQVWVDFPGFGGFWRETAVRERGENGGYRRCTGLWNEGCNRW